MKEETVDHVRKGLVGQEQDKDDYHEIRVKEHTAQIDRPVFVDHQSYDVRTSCASAVAHGQTDADGFEETGNDRDKQRLPYIEERALDTVQSLHPGKQLHREGGHGYGIYGLESEAYAHQDDCDENQQGIDDDIGICRRHKTSGGILEDRAESHHATGRHTVGNHEAFPGECEHESRKRQDQIVPDYP